MLLQARRDITPPRASEATEAPARMQDTPGSGTLLGRRYRLLAPLGHRVEPGTWQALDEVLARTVVVQCLPPGTSLALARFAAVRAAARLTDPRLARIFDADDSGDCPYLVCEHAPGQPLDQMLGAGLPGPALAATVIAEAASALAGAHAAGAAHLCLTPGSLRWGETGLKITGLAVESALTGVTDVSPGVADSRALGQILYALLTGYWPGTRATGLPSAPRHRDQPYPPRQIRRGVPAELNAITCEALGQQAGNSDARFADVADLAAALREASAVPARRRRQRARAGHTPPAADFVAVRPALPRHEDGQDRRILAMPRSAACWRFQTRAASS